MTETAASSAAVRRGEAIEAASRAPKVAMALLGIGDLSGGGGAERFFAEVFERYRRWPERRYTLKFVTDPASLERLRRAGRLTDCAEVTVLARPRLLPEIIGYALQVRALAQRGAFDVLHVALVSRYLLVCLWLLRFLRRGRRPQLAVNVVDCTLAHTFFNPARIQGLEQRKSYWLHQLLFSTVPLDGVFTWYPLFEERLAGARPAGRPAVVAGRRCFVDTEQFRPARDKEALIVFAARFVEVKRPLFFVEGVRRALALAPDQFRGWHFHMYGRGPLEPELQATLRAHQLDGIIETSFAPDLAAVFTRSRAFVSTQEYENFSSVAMLEAMAAGNAIIARPVGQTAAFVEHRGNGLVLDADDPDGLARALVEYVCHPDCHNAFARRSRELVTEVHTFGNFALELESFWCRVIERSNSTIPSP